VSYSSAADTAIPHYFFTGLVPVAVMVLFFLRSRVGWLAVPMMLLVFLAVTGEAFYLQKWGYELLAWSGVRFQYQDFPPWPPEHIITLPLGIVLMMWLAWEIDRKFRVRPPHPQCRTCGYDLTGNTSGVCPECGQKKEGQC